MALSFCEKSVDDCSTYSMAREAGLFDRIYHLIYFLEHDCHRRYWTTHVVHYHAIEDFEAPKLVSEILHLPLVDEMHHLVKLFICELVDILKLLRDAKLPLSQALPLINQLVSFGLFDVRSYELWGHMAECIVI